MSDITPLQKEYEKTRKITLLKEKAENSVIGVWMRRSTMLDLIKQVETLEEKNAHLITVNNRMVEAKTRLIERTEHAEDTLDRIQNEVRSVVLQHSDTRSEWNLAQDRLANRILEIITKG